MTSRDAWDEFEGALLTERVAMRSAGYTGWDPPEGSEVSMPHELWDEAIKLFPHALQREFDPPEEDEDTSHGDLTGTLSNEVALSLDSGISLSAVRTLSVDADEDGAYQHTSDKLEYTLWIDNKDWSGDSVQRLRAHLPQFERVLKDHDPMGYAKFSGR